MRELLKNLAVVGHPDGRLRRSQQPCISDVSEPTVSRIVAEHRQNLETTHAGQP